MFQILTFRIFGLLAVAVSLLVCGCSMAGIENSRKREPYPTETHASTHAVVYGNSVASPLGRLMLVRADDEVCVLRFTSFKSEYDYSSPSWFSTGGEHVAATVEWYYQPDGSSDFSKSNVQNGVVELRRGPSYGIGRWIWSTSANFRIPCGKYDIDWNYPISVMLFRLEAFTPSRILIAPTAWEKLSDVQFRNWWIPWHGRSAQDGVRLIPLRELEGYVEPVGRGESSNPDETKK